MRELILKNLAENNCLQPGIYFLEIGDTAFYIMCYPLKGVLTVMATDLVEDETWEFEARGPLFAI